MLEINNSCQLPFTGFPLVYPGIIMIFPGKFTWFLSFPVKAVKVVKVDLKQLNKFKK